MLEPAGGFGKFVAVLLALSVVGNIVSLATIPEPPGTQLILLLGGHFLRNYAELPSLDSTSCSVAPLGLCHRCDRSHHPISYRSGTALLYGINKFPRL
jgi:hypothetical protein